MRVLGSLHGLPNGAGFAEPPLLFERHPADEVIRAYLAEGVRLAAWDGPFSVLARSTSGGRVS